jgi:hypothetical protein
MKNFKYLETTPIHKYSIHEEIKRTLKSENAWYHSVLNLFPSSLLPKNIKINMHRTTVLPFCMGVKLGLSY